MVLILLSQYNWGIHLGEDPALNVRVEGAKFVQMAAREILLRREAKDIKIGNNYSYPSFMYSPTVKIVSVKSGKVVGSKKRIGLSSGELYDETCMFSRRFSLTKGGKFSMQLALKYKVNELEATLHYSK